jgi:hypothetical protein
MARTYSTWNSADKFASLTLSNGDLTAETGFATGCVRGTQFSGDDDTTDNPYFEITIDDVGSAAQVGLATADAALNAAIGGDNYGWAYRHNGTLVHGGSSTSGMPTFTTGDVIGVYFDGFSNRVYFRKNGTWINSGDPDAGTGYCFSSITGDIYPIVGGYNFEATANFGASAFEDEPPAVADAGFYFDDSVGVTAPPIILTTSLDGSAVVPITADPVSVAIALGCGDISVTQIQRTRQFYRVWITGTPDGLSDLEVVSSSVQCRARSGDPTFVQAVIPGMAAAEAIAERPNGDIVVELVYTTADGIVLQAEEIARAAIEDIQTHEGPRSESIVIEGRKTTTHTAKTVNLSGLTYRRTAYGRTSLRFAIPDPYLRPGDTVTTDEGDSIVADSITYTLSAKQISMEISEA